MSHNRIQNINKNFYRSKTGRSTPTSASVMIAINIGGWKRGNMVSQHYRIIES